MHVVKMSEFRNRDVLEELETLVELARKKGRVEGLTYVIALDDGQHLAGMAGEYKRHPEKALQATFMLERHLARTGPFADAI